jgi:hypothetical protein
MIYYQGLEELQNNANMLRKFQLFNKLLYLLMIKSYKLPLL